LESRNERADQRRKYLVAVGDLEGDEFVLSFDDGPHYRFSNRVLDGLLTVAAPAVFFVLGSKAKRSAEVLRRISREGHEIGVHGWHHKTWANLTRHEVREEIVRTAGFIEDVTGRAVKYCRPPYGILPEHAAAAVSELGLLVVGWHLSSRDWLGLSSSEIVIELAVHSPRGKILLFHDGSGEPESSATVVPWLVRAARGKAVFPVPLSDYLKKYEIPECGAKSSRPRLR
jgi:peptidoglycan/xylan/chitin deacetylase (PgdA/CDA1 family)